MLSCNTHTHTGAIKDFSAAIEVEPRYADTWKRRGQVREMLLMYLLQRWTSTGRNIKLLNYDVCMTAMSINRAKHETIVLMMVFMHDSDGHQQGKA
jgi:hypothetical protein